MTAVTIVGLIFAFILAVLGIIFGSVISLARIGKGGSIRKGEQFHADETRIIQEIYQGLSKMEKRVESLETILLEKETAYEKGKRERKSSDDNIL